MQKSSLGGVEKRRPHSRPLSLAQQKLRSRLEGGHFRLLNEQLYTTTSTEAYNIFNSDLSLFESYHRGYSLQIRRWPYNPLDMIISYLKKLPKSIVVADCGCGDARLAREASQDKVYSFDLVSVDDNVVTVADIAHLPLGDEKVDVCVFCLSLMGVNYAEFLQEAHRVLKIDGKLIIAEVASRFDGCDPTTFRKAVTCMGFREAQDGNPQYFGKKLFNRDAGRRKQRSGASRKKRIKNQSRNDGATKRESLKTTPFFYSFMFVKDGRNVDIEAAAKLLPPLRACTYKKR